MKKILLLPALALCIIASCNKKDNNYSNTDYTRGMTNVRHWAGPFDGFVAGDTVYMGTLRHDWPKHYQRTKTDTAFSIISVDGYDINVLGAVLPYRKTDAVLKTMTFDSVIVGVMDATLTYYYTLDSMSFTYHRVGAYNSDASQYIQDNINIHTIHS